MWKQDLCNNEDSCLPAQTHLFPEPGTVVDVPLSMVCPKIGDYVDVQVTKGSYIVGEHISHDSHQVSLTVDSQLVWADIDEIVEHV